MVFALSSTDVLIGTIAEQITDIVLHQLFGRAGVLYAWTVSIKDKYVWGIGTNNIATALIGLVLLLKGQKIGLPWLVTFVATKLLTEPLWNYLSITAPVYPKLLIPA